MTDLMRQAIERVSGFPPEQQDEFARVLLRLAGDEGGVYRFTPEEEVDLDEADREIERGEIATPEEVEAMFARHRA